MLFIKYTYTVENIIYFMFYILLEYAVSGCMKQLRLTDALHTFKRMKTKILFSIRKENCVVIIALHDGLLDLLNKKATNKVHFLSKHCIILFYK